MGFTLQRPGMTRDEFFAWEPLDDRRCEFDGFTPPVAMTGGTINHARIRRNIHSTVNRRLRDTPCEVPRQNAGIATIGDAVRYPDALVTCRPGAGEIRIAKGVVIVLEVLSPTSGRTDRIDKVREYQAVPSILRYAIVESRNAAMTVFERAPGTHAWTRMPLVAGDILHTPEIGFEVPVADFYDRVTFGAPATGP